MTTVQEIIGRVDDVKPNAYSNAQKVAWLNELEGNIQLEIYLKKVDELTRLETVNDDLLVPFPFDSIYNYYLQAMIDFHNGEYDRYENTYAMYNSKLEDYMVWYTTHYPTVGSIVRGVTEGGN